MNKTLLGVFLGVVLLVNSGCAFLTRDQVKLLEDTAFLLETRGNLNDRATEHLAKDIGADHPAITIINQNTELDRNTAATLRTIVGSD